MATAQTSQARQKRVQEIADDAAEKIAAESDLEEDVVVIVEELPPGAAPEGERTPRQQAAAVPFASQKEFALRVAETMKRGRAG